MNTKSFSFYLVLLVFLSAVLLGTACTCCRAEDSYRLYGSELTRLQQICEKLDKLNNQLSSELTTSKQNLAQLQNELENCKTELTQLQNQLQESKAESEQLKTFLMTAKNLLQKAENSFEQYKKEAESKIRKLTIQRNILTAIATILGILAL